jgi:hypothetical protein
MITRTLLSAFGITLLAAISGFAQEKPGTIASLEFQTPKSGMAKQYEDGRKQKAEWHKQQKDAQPLMVWETVSGDHTGTYIVGRLGQHWADFDKPSVPEQADSKNSTRSLARMYSQLSRATTHSCPSSANRPILLLPRSSRKSSPSVYAPAKGKISVAP